MHNGVALSLSQCNLNGWTIAIDQKQDPSRAFLFCVPLAAQVDVDGGYRNWMFRCQRAFNMIAPL